jgi:hypothetical protein
MKYAMSDNLVQRCLDGEQDAFTLLVEKYKGYVSAISKSVTNLLQIRRESPSF